MKTPKNLCDLSPKTLLFLLILLLFITSRSFSMAPATSMVSAVIMFGDSIVDTGNNNYLPTVAKCNFPPYGRDFDGGKPTGRFSNGRVPSDLIVEKLGIKEFLPAYNQPGLQYTDIVNGVNFASGGSGYDPLTPLFASAISLEEQVQKMKAYKETLAFVLGEDGASGLFSNALFLVMQGSNDILNTYYLSRARQYHFTIDSYTTFLVQIAYRFLKELYEAGARKVGVFGTPPLGCLPSQRILTGGIEKRCNEEYNDAAKLFNSKLESALSAISGELGDATMAYLDIFTPVMELLTRPDDYGFKYVKSGCCGTGNLEVAILCNKYSPGTCDNSSEYLFWDSFHPTEAAYKIVVDKIFDKYANLL